MLVAVSVVTVFAPITSAEVPTPSIPDLSEYSYITIDEIEPSTTVNDLTDNTVLSATEEIDVYDTEGILLIGCDYVCNGATIIISDNNIISEVYKVKLYGDLDCDGSINSSDLILMRRTLLRASSPVDDTVADTNSDGELDVLDLIRLKKNLLNVSEISQSRMFAYTERFTWLNTLEVPFSINGYEEAFEDLSVVSNDIDLTFSRYYDSFDTTAGILGLGWTASFEGSCDTYNGNSKIVKVYGQAPVVFEFLNNEYVCDYTRSALSAVENGFVFTAEDGLTYTFNQNGYLVSITDKNSNTVSVTVDTNGKIQKVTDSVGREYNYTYGENGLLSSITDCMNRTVAYSYDSSNRLESVTGVLRTITEQYSYNSNNKLTRVSDAFENRIYAISYEDNSGIVSSLTDSEGVTTDYAYNPKNNSVTLSQDNIVTEEYVYNRYNYLTSSNTEEGLQENFYCNRYGDIAVSISADGSKTKYEYDINGNPIKITTISEEETVTEKNSYDENGNILSSVTGNETTNYTYDSNGNTLSVIKYTDGEETERAIYTYNNKGLPTTSLVDGVTTSYSYNNYGYLMTETELELSTPKTYTYNSVGWLLSEAEADSSVSYVYNLNGDTLRETKNSVVTSRTVYDNYGRIKQQISEAEYSPAYDNLNSSLPIDSYLNNSQEVAVGIRYYYGEDGKISQIKASCYTVATDSNQKVTSVTAGNTVLAQYNYPEDAKELLSSVSYANGQSISYNYDTNGNVTSLCFGDTLAYTYTYDEEDTLTSKINLIENIRTDYTDDSFVVSHIEEDGSLVELYSYLSEMLIEIDFPAGTIGQEFIPAEEDEEADLERITEKFAGKTFYTDYYENYLDYGLVRYSTTKNEDDAVSNTKVKKYFRDFLNSDYTYNEDNLPSGLTNTYKDTEDNYTYTYDDNGNITAVTKNGNEKRYYYDNKAQLVRVDDEEANQTVEYVYNGVSGNITAVNVYELHEKDAELSTAISTKSFGYAESGWSDLLTSVNGNALTYDALGNLLTYNGYTYTWEAGRRLASISNGTNTYSYKYDDNGIRTQKTINGTTTYYTTVDGRITGQYDGTNTIYFRYNADNALIGFNLNDTEYIYLKNIQGDIEGILDLNGNLVVQYTYDAWGKLLSITDTSNINLGTLNPMRYRGYYYDNETGYYYLQSRYYTPEFCRFINADEPDLIISNLELATVSNLFVYCNNNPINYIDPSGNWAIFVGVSISVAAFFVGVSAMLGLLFDGKGNIGLIVSGNYRVVGIAASAGVCFGFYWKYKTIFDYYKSKLGTISIPFVDLITELGINGKVTGINISLGKGINFTISGLGKSKMVTTKWKTIGSYILKIFMNNSIKKVLRDIKIYRIYKNQKRRVV